MKKKLHAIDTFYLNNLSDWFIQSWYWVTLTFKYIFQTIKELPKTQPNCDSNIFSQVGLDSIIHQFKGSIKNKAAIEPTYDLFTNKIVHWSVFHWQFFITYI